MVIPVDNDVSRVEVCLDYDQDGDMYIMRFESMTHRIMFMVDGGREPFVEMFEQFIENFQDLQAAI
jgi:hypothetical protein